MVLTDENTPTGKTPKHTSVSIVLPTHNRCQALERTLDALGRIERPEHIKLDLVVVANCCTDQTVQMVEQKAGQMPFPARCVEEHTAGASAARNRGIDETDGDIVAFVDDDVCVAPQWLGALLNTFEEYGADLVQGRIVLDWQGAQRPSWWSEDFEWILARKDFGDQVIQLHDRGKAASANLAFRRSVFDKVGRFLTGIGPIGNQQLRGEDSDLVERSLDAGMRFYYCPGAAAEHWLGAHRITADYLCDVARGNGCAYALMKKKFTGPRGVVTLVHNAVFMLRKLVIEVWHRLKGDRERAMAIRIERSMSLGRFQGTWQRLRGRSPIGDA